MSSTTFDINVNTQQAIASISTLQGRLAALATSAALVEFATLADDMAKLKTQLTSVTLEGQKVNDMMKIMQKGAIESGQSIEAYTETFVRMAGSTRDLGITQKALVDVTTTVSRAMSLSGKSTIETAASLNQLGQMFGKGAAEADDLNTILDNSAILSDALQKHYHATAGALRVMASEHKITSKGILASIQEAKGAVDEAWGKRYITVSESMNVMKITAMQVTDTFAEQMNLGRALEIIIFKLAAAFINIGKVVSTVVSALEIIGLVLITLYAPIGRIVAFLIEFGMRATWLRTMVVGAFEAFTSPVQSAKKLFAWFGESIVTIFEAIKAPFVLLKNIFTSLGEGVTGISSVFTRLKLIVAAVLTGLSDFIGGAETVNAIFARAAVVGGLFTTVWTAIAGAFEYVIGMFKEGSTIFESVFSIFSDGKKPLDDLAQAQLDYANAMGFDTVEAMNKALGATGQLSTAQMELQKAGTKAVDDIRKSYDDLHNSTMQTTAGIGLSSEQQAKVNGSLSVITKYRDSVKELQKMAEKDIAANVDDQGYKERTLKELATATDNLKVKMEEALAVTNADTDAQIQATRASEQRIFALNQLYAQQDAIEKLNQETAKVGLSNLDQKYKDIEASAKAAADSQLRAIAAARGITVDQIPSTDRNAVIEATTRLLKDQTDAQTKLTNAQQADALDTALLNMRIKKTDEINKLNRDAANVGLPLVQQQYNNIRNAANDAADAQMRSIAASRGITVEQLPQSDRQAIIDATTASLNKQMDAQDALNKKIAENNIIQATQKHNVDNQKELRKIQDDINRTTMPAAIRLQYDLEAAANESAKAEIAAEAARRGIKTLPIEEAKAYYDLNTKGLQEIIDKTRELQAAQDEQTRKAFVNSQQYAAVDKIRAIQDDIAKSGMTEIEKKYYDIDAAARQSAESELRALAARKNISREQLDASTVAEYYKAAAVGSDELKRATEAGYNNSRTFATGWKQALNSYTEDATNAAKQAQDIFKTTTKGMEDMIVNFAVKGKFEWKSFLATVVEELLRSQITVLFANILNGGSSGGGGILDSIMGLFGMGGSGSSGGVGGSGKVMGTQSNPVYTILMNGGANSVAQQGKSNNNALGNIVKGVTNAASGTSLWDDFTGGLSNFFTGNSGASSSNSSYGVLQSDKNSGSSIWDDVGDFFGGLFATGGNLPAGKWGIAGESGPELIRGPASISSASQTQSDLGSTNVTYNINAVDAQSFKAMIAADPSFIYAVSQQGARSTPMRRG
jgi:lambda family phage tail tape measure protein